MSEDEKKSAISAKPSVVPEAPLPPQSERWRLVVGGASLALGLLSSFSCIFGLLPGIPALVLGFIASSKSSRTGERMPGTGMACTGILFGCVGVAISLKLLSLVIAEEMKVDYSSTCQSNLKRIGACLEMYTEANNGAFPDQLSRLYPKYVNDQSLSLFVCPNTETKAGDPVRIDEWTDYDYVPANHRPEVPVGFRGPLCLDSEYRHKGMRKNVLYENERVAFIKGGHSR